MTELNERVLVAAAALINDIRSMQAGQADSEKDWFEGFSTWEYDSKPDGSEYGEDDTVAIEWPNLALSVENLDQALKAVYELRQAKMQAALSEIEMKMVLAGKTQKEE
jgi:hypothetical protein